MLGALIAGGFAAPLLVVRTALEDLTLWDELDSDQDYAWRMRYRLLPRIW